MSEAQLAAGRANLIPADQRPKLEQQILGRRGGLARTEAKSEAAVFREIRKRIDRQMASKEDAEWMMDKLNNRTAMTADIALYLDEIKRSVNPNQRIALANAMKDLAKFQHGDKVQVESVNVNINTTIEEMERRLLD